MEQLREENRRLKGETNSSGDACASTGEDAIDPRMAELDNKIAFFSAEAASAKRDLAKVSGIYKDVLKARSDEADKQVTLAKEQKVALRQATLDPQVAFEEENKRNLGLKRRLEEMGKSLLKDGEALEKAREKVEDQRNKYREARRQLEVSSAKLKQQACLRTQRQNPGEQIQALCSGLGTQLKVLDQAPEIEAGEE